MVDAAVAVQSRGADVTIFTTRHDTSRCFEETRDGMSPKLELSVVAMLINRDSEGCRSWLVPTSAPAP